MPPGLDATIRDMPAFLLGLWLIVDGRRGQLAGDGIDPRLQRADHGGELVWKELHDQLRRTVGFRPASFFDCASRRDAACGNPRARYPRPCTVNNQVRVAGVVLQLPDTEEDDSTPGNQARHSDSQLSGPAGKVVS